ncbi:MAG: polysaccharide deacetylase family protein [Actinobacteria bacterium]|nr:polysaccharide deacetylase family protein [Actinomycetota bacterium]MBU4336822.1 polysaccharide deacetylase family protein [Actinomycetota bacterium]MCG2802060.1 polysaccharide deacetylase family protein [Cellulomonas sp.]
MRELPGPLRLLGPRARRWVRRVADLVLAPVSSVAGGRVPGEVAVTFDDGPEPAVTPALLGVLAHHRVTCTFFLLVNQAEQHPELVRAIVAAGHEVALHGLDHRPLPPLGHRGALRYLREARRRLEAVTGRPVHWYRPPYGKQSAASWAAARRAGLDVVVWSADAADWEDVEVADVVALAHERLVDGGILLLHERVEPGPAGEPVETRFDRVEVVDQVLADLRDRGLRPVTVGALARRAHRTAWFR